MFELSYNMNCIEILMNPVDITHLECPVQNITVCTNQISYSHIIYHHHHSPDQVKENHVLKS